MPNDSRRDFLKTSAVTGAGLASSQLAFAQEAKAVEKAAHTGVEAKPNNDLIRVALVGCGGRGRGAGVQTLKGDPNTKIVALGDAFQEPMDSFLNIVQGIDDVKDRIDVPADRQFTGLDCCEQLLNKVDVDLVCLASPPHFRPMQYRAAVEAGKHVFTEKPVAVDGPGLRETMAVNELAKEKGLSVVSGLCWRYETGMIETVNKIREGIIGRPTSALSVRYSGHVGRNTPREESKTEFEHQIRNWYFYPWLSGDFCVEQFVHDLDMTCWALDEYPTSVVCTGGRETRDEKEGPIYDHFAAMFSFDSGVEYTATTRHQNGCSNPYFNRVTGTDGVMDLMRYEAKDHSGDRIWRRKEKRTVMHQLEHDAMYKAIRAGHPLHNGDYMTKSTLTGIMMRESAYTGKEVTAEQMMNSELHRAPSSYAWTADPPNEGLAVPGATPFV